MATRQDLQDALSGIQSAIEADVAQDIKVVEAVNALLAKLEAAGNIDFQVEVDALKAASLKLGSDNAIVQAAIDAAVPPAE